MTNARRYAREIEARWTALLERPAVLGERDWSVICEWHARGIPLGLIAEAFEEFATKLRRRRSKPRNLGALAPLVDEAWRTVCGGRTPTREEGVDSDAEDRGRASSLGWRHSAEKLPSDDPLRAWILELLRDLEGKDTVERCEARLREGLLVHLSPDVLAELELAVDADLAVFRDRMSAGTWQATRRRSLISAARRRFGLPELADRVRSPKDA